MRRSFWIALGMALAIAGVCDVARGRMMYASDTGRILRIAPDGSRSVFAENDRTDSVDNARGLTFDGGGNLYVALVTNNRIERFTPAAVPSVFATGMNVPTGLAFDAAGNLY